MKFRRVANAFIALLFACSGGLLIPATVSAAPKAFICTAQYEAMDGRCMYQSYFSGMALEDPTYAGVGALSAPLVTIYRYVDSLGPYLNDDYAFPSNTDGNNANAAANFVSFVSGYLNSPNPATLPFRDCVSQGFPNATPPVDNEDGCSGYRMKVLWAAFTVLTMLGGKYTTYDVGTVFGNSANTGVADARAEFNTWKTDVMNADAAGQIEWNAARDFPDNHPNTGSRGWNKDLGMFLQGQEIGRHTIVFHMPGGDYIINRRCGNAVSFAAFGSVAPPPSPSNPPICDALATNVPYIDPSRSFMIHASISYAGASGPADATAANAAGDKIGISISGPSLTYPLTKFGPTVSGNVLTAITPTLGPVTAGTYAVKYNLYNSSGSKLITTDCSGTFKVANLPYFVVNGGDVSAGGGMEVN
ncbi:MAG TPA: hypothetical protein VLG47_06390 [Candidatus Saccharimonadales bacterium]|nr:hypothetical protein [Candidatus Saccharimonadales bacterium]